MTYCVVCTIQPTLFFDLENKHIVTDFCDLSLQLTHYRVHHWHVRRLLRVFRYFRIACPGMYRDYLDKKWPDFIPRDISQRWCF